MSNSKTVRGKKFRKQGGSHLIAIKNEFGSIEINAKDTYTIEYKKNSITITKEINNEN